MFYKYLLNRIVGRRYTDLYENNTAQRKAFKITILYFIIGCTWISFSDKFVQLSFSVHNQVVYYSIVKGILYVFVSSILIYCLTYLQLKKTLEEKEALSRAETELEKTNELYKWLNQDYDNNQTLLKSLIDSIPDLVFYKDINSVYLGCNSAFESFARKKEQDIIGHTDWELFSAHEAEIFVKTDREMISKNSFTKKEITVTYPDGKELIFETLKTPYHDKNGKVIGLIGIGRDITERKNREDKVRYISYHDMMTGIYNRTYFEEVQIAIDRPDQLPLSVIVGDVNGMKLINDTFGHMKGDMVLQEMVKILKQCVRKGDIIARTGGDEFTILMPHTDAQAVKEVVYHIRALCEEKRHEENNDLYIDIALGYATKSDPEDSLDKVIMLAEDLMYRRKMLEQKSPHNDYLSYIKMTMFEKSNETEEHAERLVKLSKRLGEEMGLSENQLDELELVALLHDIGKISIDKDILAKPGKLSQEDWREIKKHPEVGYRIANSTFELKHIAEYILCHHERWDGGGYPLGLSGNNIPLISRIIAVVDSYDAMTQDRAYRKAMSEDVAVQEILRNKGTQFDPNIADIFVNKVLCWSLES